MTRPSKSALVLDGNEVKLRLEAERSDSKTPVHVDWVRFTCLLRNAPAPSVDDLFPRATSVWDEAHRQAEFQKVLREIPDHDYTPSVQALNLAREVAQALGDDFTVAPEVRKGHDFYRFRWSIERNGQECGWVGYLSSGDSPRQQAQARTIHCNLFGAACTFARHGWNHRLADMVDSRDGDLTRCDLALDFFDGMEGGIESILADYKAGLCDVGGKRLKSNMVGRWAEGCERSLYFGSKEAGKQTNCYEKGHQLFGPESGSQWLRIELRYGNKLRVLSSDMLRRPADFFAGASDWHTSMLLNADAIVTPEAVKCNGRLAAETVEAEVTRNVRWTLENASPSIAIAFHCLGDEFLEFVTNKKLPGRLQRFSLSEIKQAFGSAFRRVSTVEGYSPAFA